MKDVMVVLANAVDGQRDVFNDWYDKVHAVDVLTRMRGFECVSRYRALDSAASPSPWQYIALWEVSSDVGIDVAFESIRDLRTTRHSGRFDAQDTMYVANPGIREAVSTWFSQVDRVDGDRGADSSDDHLLVIFSNNTPGSDAEFDAWYAEHCRDIVGRLDAFKSAERYVAAPRQLDEPAYRHMVVYRVDHSELAKARTALSWQRAERTEALAAGRRPVVAMSQTMADPRLGTWFSPLSKVSRAGLAAEGT